MAAQTRREFVYRNIELYKEDSLGTGSYLHSNGLTHRDLTGNNVLMIAGVRAKVTDFGMSKLASVNPRMTPMTLCPGNVQYMSPEALEEPPSYTDKLDVFSFGVLLVQIMTRQFPNPGPRFQGITVPNYPDGTIRMAVPETQRRSAHLKLIADTHPLKAVAIACLKDREKERPSAQQLSNMLSQLKRAPQYTESLQQAQTGVWGGREAESLRGQVQDLQQQNHTMEQEMEQQRAENEQLQTEHDRVLAQVQQLQNTYQEKERELGQNREQLACKDRTIGDLRQTISAHERKIQQLEQQDKHAGSRLPQSSAVAKVPQAAVVPAVPRNIPQLRWEEGKRATQELYRGTAVVYCHTIYINPSSSSYGSSEVYSCRVISGDQQWSTLPRHRYHNFSLVHITGLLTSVGGYGSDHLRRNSDCTNSLLSLTGKGRKRQWSEVFPAMPTPRSLTASVTTEQALIVAGGFGKGGRLDTVEVMDIESGRWTTASRLPHPFNRMSATICGDQLYLAGGVNESGKASKSVLTCSLADLLPPQSLGARLHTLSLADMTGVWRQAKDLPVTSSTLTTLGGHLLAIGGKDDSDKPTAAVHCYDASTDSWHVLSQMMSARSMCLAAALPEDRLFVVGGWKSGRETDSLEIGRIP